MLCYLIQSLFYHIQQHFLTAVRRFSCLASFNPVETVGGSSAVEALWYETWLSSNVCKKKKEREKEKKERRLGHENDKIPATPTSENYFHTSVLQLSCTAEKQEGNHSGNLQRLWSYRRVTAGRGHTHCLTPYHRRRIFW